MPDGGKRTPLALSYSWGQTALETQFASTFQPGHGIFSPGTPLVPPEPEDRPSGDPTGAVLGFALASRILGFYGGRVEEREGGLWLVFPPAA